MIKSPIELPPDDPELGPEYVWLGDLSGFEIETDIAMNIFLRHRCGWFMQLPENNHLGDIVQEAIYHRRRTCEKDKTYDG